MNLYKLELMKIRQSTYWWAISGIFVSLLALGILFLFLFQSEIGENDLSKEADLLANWTGLLTLTTALAFACFSILSAAIAAKVIVSEYCGSNAVILLSYPVRRRKILGTKCLMICGITTTSACISNLLVVGLMYVTAHIFKITPQMDTKHFVLTVFAVSILIGISSSALGIISTVFGWKKRSVIATIVSSVLIVCCVTNLITISPRNLIWVILAMSMVFVVIANFMYRILANRIEGMEV